MAEASEASNFIHHNNNSANIKSETSSNSGSLPSKKLSLSSSVKQTPNNNYKHAPSQQLDLPTQNFYQSPPEHSGSFHIDDEINDGLGPLPQKWEKAYTENGESYFIDHNTGTSHWLDPRLSKFQKKSLEDCLDDELPYGWEKIHDPQYGTYFIDHVNRRTQYENPVLEAKRRVERKCEQIPRNSFTRNPVELCGQRLTTTLLKSSRGLGFTIVGGDDNVDEFLQIKSLVPNGPAWLDGKLQMGDILVFVNDTCVLGFTHHEMVNVFQSIQPGETVTLDICRGYPLPFDPSDPNTEVVTTIAVDGVNSDPEKSRIMMDFNMDGNYNFLDTSDTAGAVGGGSVASDKFVDVRNGGSNGLGIENLSEKNPLTKIQSGSAVATNESSSDTNNINDQKPEILNITIAKGAVMGFGFTIADSAYGQKVKKILDSNCCTKLVEGDYLLAINNVNVKHMSHSEVVQVLKDCPKGQEAMLKIQRGHFANLGKANRMRHVDDGFTMGTSNKKDSKSGLFRSKTPTADIYSTQPKEILPVRPKTPIVDTRNRAKTPSIEISSTVKPSDSAPYIQNNKNSNDNNEAAAVLENNLADHDSINNEVPYMDPFPKLVSTLSDRLAETSFKHEAPNNIYHTRNNQLVSSQSELNFDHHIPQQEYYVSNYNTAPHVNNVIYSPPSPLPIMAPVPTYHQDTCYCYECQDYGRYQQDIISQSSQYSYPAHLADQKRINDYMLDRRKAGFSPLESHTYLNSVPLPSHLHQHKSNHPVHHPSYWKYNHPSSGYIQPNQDEYTLSEVTLDRQALGFGFRIVGGTEEGSQVTVGHVVPGGSADGDHRIESGDEILSIDGHNVVQGSHHRVVQLMGEAAIRGKVTMILRRKKRPVSSIRYPYDIILSRNENESFGFVISSSQHYGSTIGKLVAGSPAERCEDLKVDDKIVAVNQIDITGMSHGDVVNLVKESGLHVRLTIGNPKENIFNGAAVSQQQQHFINSKNDAYFDNFPISLPQPQL